MLLMPPSIFRMVLLERQTVYSARHEADLVTTSIGEVRNGTKDSRLGSSIRRFNGLSLGYERTRSSPLRSPPVPQLGRNARREKRLSSAGCCKRAPDTSAAAHPRERSGARRHRTPWAYRRTWDRPGTSDCPNNRALTR